MDRPHPGRLTPAVTVAWLGALAVLLAAYAAVILGPIGGSAVQDAFGRWVYDAIVLGAAAAVLVRAAYLPGERLAWLSLGVGLLLWALGQTYYSVALYYASPAPFPSPSDALFLAFYPATFLALVLLLRSRSARVDSFAWVDGLIGALAVAAVAAALIFPPVLAALGGDTLGRRGQPRLPLRGPGPPGAGGRRADHLPLAHPRRLGADRRGADPLRGRGRRLPLGRRAVDRGAQPGQHRLAAWPSSCSPAPPGCPHAAVEPARKRSGRSIVLPILLAATVVCLLAVGNLDADRRRRGRARRRLAAGGARPPRGDLLPQHEDARLDRAGGDHRRAHRPAQPAQPAGRPGPGIRPPGRERLTSWRSSTSTASSLTTTASATRPATNCSSASAPTWRRRRRPGARPTASEATSSACSPRSGRRKPT